MNEPTKKLISIKNDMQAVIDYADDIFRAELTLAQLEEVLNIVNLFWCSKSIIIFLITGFVLVVIGIACLIVQFRM